MRKILNLMIVLLLTFLITSCKSNTLLDKSKPVTINMWHVYGEQVNSPMSQYIQEFNSTIGKEKGIIIEVTLLSNAHSIGDTLRRSYNNEPGAPDMPDLFTGHISDALILNKEDRVNWKNTFTTSELNSYDEVFINDGIIDDTLSIFPVSKSTYALYVAGGVLDRFLRSNSDLSSDLLNTWDGFLKLLKDIMKQKVNHLHQSII